MLVIVSLLFFFFQAEDGIRYLIVTGVQTCALPISRATGNAWPWLSVACRLASVVVVLASSVSGDRHDLARGGVNQNLLRGPVFDHPHLEQRPAVLAFQRGLDCPSPRPLLPPLDGVRQ